MKEIQERLEEWLDAQESKTGRICVEDIRPIWHVSAKNKQSALECLNRPGWENVYAVMKDLHDTTQKQLERQEKGKNGIKPTAQKYDWAVNRIGDPSNEGGGDRLVIPNFV